MVQALSSSSSSSSLERQMTKNPISRRMLAMMVNTMSMEKPLKWFGGGEMDHSCTD